MGGDLRHGPNRPPTLRPKKTLGTHLTLPIWRAKSPPRVRVHGRTGGVCEVGRKDPAPIARDGYRPGSRRWAAARRGLLRPGSGAS